jgi:Nitrile hydratase beta subunit, N-terminal
MKTWNRRAELMGKLTYYERWIVGAANLLLQKQILTPDEIAHKTDEVGARFSEEERIHQSI